MNGGRFKFEVWSPEQQQWRVAYVKPELVRLNLERMMDLGYVVRVSGQQ